MLGLVSLCVLRHCPSSAQTDVFVDVCVQVRKKWGTELAGIKWPLFSKEIKVSRWIQLYFIIIFVQLRVL